MIKMPNHVKLTVTYVTDRGVVIGYSAGADGSSTMVSVSDTDNRILSITLPEEEIPTSSASQSTQQSLLLPTDKYKPHGVRITGSNPHNKDVSLAPNQRSAQRSYGKSGRRVILPAPVVDSAEVMSADVSQSQSVSDQQPHINVVIQTGSTEQTAAALQTAGLQVSAGSTDNLADYMLKIGDDQDTQALLSSFIAAGNSAAAVAVSAETAAQTSSTVGQSTTVTVGEDTVNTGVSSIPQRLKLTEQVQVCALHCICSVNYSLVVCTPVHFLT